MAAHSSTLARRIPWTEEPGRLQSMGSQRVGHESDKSHIQLFVTVSMGGQTFIRTREKIFYSFQILCLCHNPSALWLQHKCSH